MTTAHPAPESAPLFFESGSRWLWVLLGPLAAGAMLWVQVSSGNGYQPLVPLTFLVVVTGFLAVQVKAARIHTCVELTEHTLRQGTETIPVAEIVGVYPPAPLGGGAGKTPPKWQSARTLGELSGLPRGRMGVGLRLTAGRNAQAWARDHRGLRAALGTLVPEYTGPFDNRDVGPFDDQDVGGALDGEGPDDTGSLR